MLYSQLAYQSVLDKPGLLPGRWGLLLGQNSCPGGIAAIASCTTSSPPALSHPSRAARARSVKKLLCVESLLQTQNVSMAHSMFGCRSVYAKLILPEGGMEEQCGTFKMSYGSNGARSLAKCCTYHSKPNKRIQPRSIAIAEGDRSLLKYRFTAPFFLFSACAPALFAYLIQEASNGQ